jgi:hypothetical protein
MSVLKPYRKRHESGLPKGFNRRWPVVPQTKDNQSFAGTRLAGQT